MLLELSFIHTHTILSLSFCALCSRGGATTVSGTGGMASIGLEASLNMMPSLVGTAAGNGNLHYLDGLHPGSDHQIVDASSGLEPQPADLLHINNNNNMVSAGPSPSSSISPLHCNNALQPDLIPHTSVALAAAAAAAVSSMASMEAIGFDQQQAGPAAAMPPLPKLEKSGEGSSPKYISL